MAPGENEFDTPDIHYFGLITAGLNKGVPAVSSLSFG